MYTTPKNFFEEKIAASLKDNPGKAKEINAIYKFSLSGDNGGTWVVDLKSDPPVVVTEDREAQCTITMKDTDFVDLVNKKLNAQMAFMQGKLKIKGDMGLAMKLQKLIQ